MAELGQIAAKVRSKNAGPFWLTVDIFCGAPDAFARVQGGLTADAVATALGADPAAMKRFDMPELNVVKFSLPRPFVQGAIDDPDMHGASWAALIAELPVD